NLHFFLPKTYIFKLPLTKGIRLTVKKLIKHNLTTRYQLSNGNYVTANKKLIIAGNY
ncbi:MAG: DUF5776 domain-containing protein, partial [Lentilactobacillus hilgardii]|uniref:DUF5776 domain-containing protein n=1 Tax=Lentilactobacillus hilgardii TaxID=1588 RepID=UPI0039EB1E76